MTEYVLSRQARADLRGIWNYSAERWSHGQADRYISQIHGAFTTIAADPRKGRQCDDIRSGYRKYPVGAHMIFYRHGRAGIEVVRVLHQSMDFERHLRDFE